MDTIVINNMQYECYGVEYTDEGTTLFNMNLTEDQVRKLAKEIHRYININESRLGLLVSLEYAGTNWKMVVKHTREIKKELTKEYEKRGLNIEDYRFRLVGSNLMHMYNDTVIMGYRDDAGVNFACYYITGYYKYKKGKYEYECIDLILDADYINKNGSIGTWHTNTY